MQNDPNRTPSPWQMVMALNQYVQQLQGQVNEQQAVIGRLCRQLDDLNERMNAAENKPYYHVDTIQYHFDQLKVEKLSGTLNIGMSAPSEEQVKEIGQLVMPGPGKLVVNEPKEDPLSGMDPQATQTPHQYPSPTANGLPAFVTPPPPYPDIRRAIDCYLDQEAPLKLQSIEVQAGIALDPYHRKLVIEDIRKQMSPRIQFYIQTLTRKAEEEQKKGTPGEGQEPAIEADVIRKTERDIDLALQNYVSRLAP
ncbi:spore germination protein GerPC [Paenibacillus sp. GCM10023250]|uniref:spore germination protein GerPC n=1 Tax=Paenibacillus sp. GCM10023250 TaxID=3252648 RepID=UPI0036098740